VVVLGAQLAGVARAVLLLHPLFCVLALCLTRMTYRMVLGSMRARRVSDARRTRVRLCSALAEAHVGWSALSIGAMAGRVLALLDE